MSILSKKLRTIREKSGLSQKDVAELTGIGYKTINNYETGVSRPDVEKLALLCNVYKVSADYFINVNKFETKENMSNLSDIELSALEFKLVEDFRKLSKYGQNYIIDQMEYAAFKYKKCDSISKQMRNA